jgi:hypothetical protein
MSAIQSVTPTAMPTIVNDGTANSTKRS